MFTRTIIKWPSGGTPGALPAHASSLRSKSLRARRVTDKGPADPEPGIKGQDPETEDARMCERSSGFEMQLGPRVRGSGIHQNPAPREPEFGDVHHGAVTCGPKIMGPVCGRVRPGLSLWRETPPHLNEGSFSWALALGLFR